jgi:hypothetical protein
VLCLIVVLLPPGKNLFAAQLNDDNDNNNNNNNIKVKYPVSPKDLFSHP